MLWKEREMNFNADHSLELSRPLYSTKKLNLISSINQIQVMDYHCFFFFLFSILVMVDLNMVAFAEDKTPTKPVINVTKHISFQDFSSSNPRLKQDLTLLGSAIISDEKSSVQIPNPRQEFDLRHLSGRALYSSPIRLLDPITQTPASFETTFSFQFQVLNGTSDFGSSIGGSGLTFIIVPDEITVGRSGPWLGMLNDVCDDDYKTVAIELDTRQNSEFGDPNDNHLGINLGSIVSTTAVNASDVGVQLNDGLIHRISMAYDGHRRFIDIRLASKTVYSGFLDLSPYLNEYMFVGFSAATGNHTQIHNVFSWNFSSVSQAELRVPSTETCQNRIMLQNSSETETVHRKTPSSFFIFLAVVVLVVIVLINLYFSSHKKDDDNEGESIVLPKKKQRPRPPNKARRYTIAEISVATRNFSELQLLGSDEKSVTYKGTMQNGCNVVVKRFLTQFFNTHGYEKRRFRDEIKAVSKVRHPNLVAIRGWCYDNQETIVVYDYIPNGSLDKWLFGVGVLPWTRRFKVVKDLADAVLYLHSKELAHKNVKTSSVFVDVSFRAVVGDFGFVLTSTGSTRFESMVSQTADVFEFGVVVVEVVAGRSRKSNPGERDLLDLAWAMHEMQEKEKLVDRRMGSIVNLEQAVRVLDIGLLCTLNENKGRPTMEEVVEYLHMEKPIPELPPGRPVCLFPYSSTTGLCSGYACTPFK